MEVSEIITILREDYLDDTFHGWETATDEEKTDQFLWTDSFLLRALTEAQRQACNRTDFLHDDETFAFVLEAGTASYTLDKRITFIEEVTFNNQPVTHMSVEELRREYPTWRSDTSMGERECKYTMRGHTMRLYPIPDAIDAGKTVYIDCFRLPLNPIESTGDELEIPDEYHRDLIWWVLYECYNKQDADGYDPRRADQYLQHFNLAFGEYIPSEVRFNQMQEPKSAYLLGHDYFGSTSTDEDW